jgi:hypothetical protein
MKVFIEHVISGFLGGLAFLLTLIVLSELGVLPL